jgi:cytochrome c-type biogenesis protein
VAAVAIDRFLGWFQRYRRYIPIVTRFAGALLVVLGVLLATGYFTVLAGWLSGLTPEVIRSRI